jgi:hypothetical protein
MSEQKIYPFNNNIETGLRMLTLLTSAYPDKFDLDHLVYFDYMIVHSGDIDQEISSLHPAVPNRNGEILVRRSLIQEGLELFMYKGLITRYYHKNGIEYGASELATPFLEALNETYTGALVERAEWVIRKYGQLDLPQLRSLITNNLSKIRNEFNLEIIK